MKVIEEGMVRIKVPVGEKISKELPVFYNPVMKTNRDIAVALLSSIDKKDMQIGLPLSGSGVRGIRFLTELDKKKIKNISFNDISPDAVKIIKKNIELNEDKLRSHDIEVSELDANLFLLESHGFDYIDIDPFGTPNPFLDSAVNRLARGAILAVTATDTSSLCGTFPKVCKRRYWAKSSRDAWMHETGLRILIRKVQLIGAQFEKALTPIFSHSNDHYMRCYFRCEKGRTRVDKVISQQGEWNGIGPLWLGNLWDSRLVRKMAKHLKTDFMQTIKEESTNQRVGFHHIHNICKRNRMGDVPKFDKLIEVLKKKGYKATRTHFSIYGIKSDITEKELVKIIKKR